MIDTRAVLVTGASSGIGRATVEYLASLGYRVFAGARKPSDLEELDAIQDVTSLKLDVTSPQDINEAKEIVEESGIPLYALINNAGIAVAGPLMDIEPEQLEKQFNVNLLGVHRVTKAFFPLLLKSKGRIVMMSSDSGFFATPFFAPYCASKHALEGYADSLRRELLLYDVNVIKIQPGRVTTDIWDKGEQYLEMFKGSMFEKEARGIGKYAIRKGKTDGLDPIEVAKLVGKVLRSRNPKTSYLIAPKTLKYKVVKHIPERWVDNMILKELKELKDS